MVYKTKSARGTQKLGFVLGQKIKPGGVVFLYGDLGAGKTTFVQGLAKGLGIKQRVNSPTFIIARKYNKFFHVDLYRLTSLDEVKNIGLEEMFLNNNVVVVEWPELIESIAPPHIKVKFKPLNDNERQIEIIY